MSVNNIVKNDRARNVVPVRCTRHTQPTVCTLMFDSFNVRSLSPSKLDDLLLTVHALLHVGQQIQQLLLPLQLLLSVSTNRSRQPAVIRRIACGSFCC